MHYTIVCLMTRLHFHVVLLFVVCTHVHSFPHVFNESFSFCEFVANDDKKIIFPDKLWTITNRFLTLHFSLCNTIQSNCLNQSASCLIQPHTGLLRFGNDFSLRDSLLVSSNGDRCHSDPSKNYTLSISLQCSDSMKLKPRLLAGEDDECNFEVTMMHPDCRPKCTEILGRSYFLDLRNFKQNILVESDDKKFSFSTCGSNPNCTHDISACEITNNSIEPLANLESQHINYDVSKAELTVRGRYKKPRTRIVRDVEILIKCNWETDFANPKHRKVQMQGKHYKFELESSFGCIKVPQQCSFTNHQNFVFNLTKLNRKQGWKVFGVPYGEISINICGSLQSEGLCAAQYSQVCHKTDNTYINRGSILRSLESHDDIIKARFTSGSTCNNSQFYMTEIEFKCSNFEKGPIFKKYENCLTILEWETPEACPLDVYKGENCYINDRVSNRNLGKLYSEIDKELVLSPKTKLLYNLCGPIHSNCGNFTNASFCLISDNDNTVIGFNTKELISENGELTLQLQGSPCSNIQNKGEIIIYFLCNYESPPPPPLIEVIQDGCKYKMTVYTPVACLYQGNIIDCVFRNNNRTYDLTSLIKKRDNFIVSGQEVDFIFNVCGPIITSPGVQCGGDTMFCMKNKTEPNIVHKYTALGGNLKTVISNDGLILEVSGGAYCRGLGFYKNVISFKCSQQRFAPTLVSENNCVFNFEWATPEGCPQNSNCVVNNTNKPDLNFDLTKLQTKIVDVTIDASTKYKFHLCRDTFTKYSKGKNDTLFLKRDFYVDKFSYIILDLQNKTCENDSITKIIFKMQCTEFEDKYEQTAFENCALNMTIHTKLVCSNWEKFAYSIPETSPVVEQIDENTLPSKIEAITTKKPIIEAITTKKPSPKTCFIKNAFTGYSFNLSEIQMEEINHQQPCPRSSFNYEKKIVELYYDGSQCESGNIQLKCDHESKSRRLIHDQKCSPIIEIQLPEACLLLKQDIIEARHTGLIAGCSVAAVFILLVAAFIFIKVKKPWSCRHIRLPLIQNKANVPVYSKDCLL